MFLMMHTGRCLLADHCGGRGWPVTGSPGEDAPGIATVAEADIAAWIERQLRHNVEHLIQMHEVGLRIINGTDAMGGYIPFDDYAVTLEMMVTGGLSAIDAIMMSTREPAKVLGLNAGALQPGYLADMIFVDGDPLNDISSMRRVRKVFREGELAYEG